MATPLTPPAPVAIPGSTQHPCGCTVTHHLAPVRGRRRTVLVATVSGPCSARRPDWTGTDFRAHTDTLRVSR